MTVREFIRSLITSTENVDKEVPLYLFTRDNHGMVLLIEQVENYALINGKIYAEKGSIKIKGNCFCGNYSLTKDQLKVKE